MSIVFLFDENPDVASAGSGGAAVEAREVCRITPLGTRRKGSRKTLRLLKITILAMPLNSKPIRWDLLPRNESLRPG